MKAATANTAIVARPQKPEIDAATVLARFEVGTLFRISKDYFFEGRIMKVTAVHDFGICSEDTNEPATNRLATKVKYFFGVPPLNYYIENGLIRHISGDASV